jgi:2-dehydro-3-deoxy-D-arabinonate dehydratase
MSDGAAFAPGLSDSLNLALTQSGLVAWDSAGHRALPRQASLDELLTADDASALMRDWIAAGTVIDRPDRDSLLAPIGSQEVWAAGVTYARSRSARAVESHEAGGDRFYDLVYDADRPELFFKATPNRVVGPHQGVRIRTDSSWNVPEPELTLVVGARGNLIGHTIGNDMSSRSIEGENPLYLPQAKVYSQSAAIGPWLRVTSRPPGGETSITMTISRSGSAVFAGSTRLSEMRRTFDELIEYLFRDNEFPKGVFLMTGTGIVPQDDFTLARGDQITITVDGLGTLTNHVV